jgi:hypothetical protein
MLSIIWKWQDGMLLTFPVKIIDGPLKTLQLKVGLFQKIMEDFYFSKKNIQNLYHKLSHPVHGIMTKCQFSNYLS